MNKWFSFYSVSNCHHLRDKHLKIENYLATYKKGNLRYMPSKTDTHTHTFYRYSLQSQRTRNANENFTSTKITFTFPLLAVRSLTVTAPIIELLFSVCYSTMFAIIKNAMSWQLVVWWLDKDFIRKFLEMSQVSFRLQLGVAVLWNLIGNRPCVHLLMTHFKLR